MKLHQDRARIQLGRISCFGLLRCLCQFASSPTSPAAILPLLPGSGVIQTMNPRPVHPASHRRRGHEGQYRAGACPVCRSMWPPICSTRSVPPSPIWNSAMMYVSTSFRTSIWKPLHYEVTRIRQNEIPEAASCELKPRLPSRSISRARLQVVEREQPPLQGFAPAPLPFAPAAPAPVATPARLQKSVGFFGKPPRPSPVCSVPPPMRLRRGEGAPPTNRPPSAKLARMTGTVTSAMNPAAVVNVVVATTTAAVAMPRPARSVKAQPAARAVIAIVARAKSGARQESGNRARTGTPWRSAHRTAHGA